MASRASATSDWAQEETDGADQLEPQDLASKDAHLGHGTPSPDPAWRGRSRAHSLNRQAKCTSKFTTPTINLHVYTDRYKHVQLYLLASTEGAPPGRAGGLPWLLPRRRRSPRRSEEAERPNGPKTAKRRNRRTQRIPFWQTHMEPKEEKSAKAKVSQAFKADRFFKALVLVAQLLGLSLEVRRISEKLRLA